MAKVAIKVAINGAAKVAINVAANVAVKMTIMAPGKVQKGFRKCFERWLKVG